MSADTSAGRIFSASRRGSLGLLGQVHLPHVPKPSGRTILKPATVADWGGTSGYFADPDGHPWEIAHHPGFPIDEDGRVRIP